MNPHAVNRSDLPAQEKRLVSIRSVHGITDFEYGLRERVGELRRRIAAYFGEKEHTVILAHMWSSDRLNDARLVVDELVPGKATDGGDDSMLSVHSRVGLPEDMAFSLMTDSDRVANEKTFSIYLEDTAASSKK
jgi:hypothetical protein